MRQVFGEERVMAKDFDPFKWLPSSEAVRKRLEAGQEEVRKLKILLKLLEELEAAGELSGEGEEEEE